MKKLTKNKDKIISDKANSLIEKWKKLVKKNTEKDNMNKQVNSYNAKDKDKPIMPVLVKKELSKCMYNLVYQI